MARYGEYTLDETIVSLLTSVPLGRTEVGRTEAELLSTVRYFGYPETSLNLLRERIDWLDRQNFIRRKPCGTWVVTSVMASLQRAVEQEENRIDDAILRVLSYDRHRDEGMRTNDFHFWIDDDFGPEYLRVRLDWLCMHGFIYPKNGRWFVTGGDGR